MKKVSNVLRQGIAVAAVFAAASVMGVDLTKIDFTKKYEAGSAEKLFSQKKYAEAQQAFEKQAEDAAGPVEKSKWQARAAIALGMQEGKYEKGIEEAKSIAHHSYAAYARMQLMFHRGKYKEIVAAFTDEPISEWPDYKVSPAGQYGRSPQDIKVSAFRSLGRAYAETGSRKQAMANLTKAIDLCSAKKKGDHFLKVRMFNELRTYAEDEERAFQISMRAVEEVKHLQSKAQYMREVLHAAAYLREQEKFDKALDVLSKGRLYNRKGFGTWALAGRFAYGRLYAAKAKAERAEAEQLTNAGKKEEAAALRKEAEKSAKKAIEQLKPIVEDSSNKSAIERAKKELQALEKPADE